MRPRGNLREGANRGSEFAACLAAGLLAGSVFGFLESLFAYGSGTLYRSDVLVYFAFDVACFALAGLALGSLVSLVPRAAPLGPAVLLFAPVLICAARGSFAPWSLAHREFVPVLRFGLTLLLSLGAAAALADLRRLQPVAGLGRFLCWSLCLQGAALLGLMARAVTVDDLGAKALWRMPALYAAYALASLLLVRLWARDATGGGRRIALASFALSTLSAGAVAQLFGTQPEALERGAPASALAKGPSVVIITLDTVRRDHLSCYGYPRRTTPHLDAFASRATLFEDAYAPSPYTLSSHASLFTGLLPSQHGAHPIPFDASEGDTARRGRSWDFPLAADLPTLAEEMRARGYLTAGIAANTAYLSAWSGLTRGFDHYQCEAGRVYRYAPLALPVFRRAWPSLYDELASELQPRAAAVTDAALAWVASIGRRPFFLFLNYIDAHSPYDPPAPYDRRFLPQAGWKAVGAVTQKELVAGRRPMSEEERAYLVSEYDGEIAYVDDALARLFRGLQAAGRFDNTLVLVTSDHGEFLGEHGLAGHEKTLYEPVLRIPFILKLPGQAKGARLTHRVTLRDVPRLVRAVLAGAGGPEQLLGAPGEADSSVLAEYWTRGAYRRLDPARYSSPLLRALRDDKFKLIQKSAGPDELYDLADDPNEERELLRGDAERASEIRGRLIASAPPLGTGRAGVAVPLDAEALERLKAIGYVQ